MIGGPAAYAVWGFYCLSGYLMTLVLNEKYGFAPRGLGRFAVNRILRIHPAYYVVCAGMFLLFYLKPGTAARFLPQLYMPATAQGWRYSLFLMTSPGGGELLHGSSALRVELWFYVAMALGLARNRWITGTWFMASVAYTIWLLAMGTPFVERYTFIPACSLAFSFGSLIYHVRDRLPVIRTPWAAVSAAAIWWLHVWLTQNIPGGPWVYGLYSSLIVSAFAMVTLMRLDPKTLSPWMMKVDRFFGNLSYPMYLCHWGVGIVVIGLFHGKSRADLSVFLIGFPVVNLISYLLYAYVEHPLQSWKLTSLTHSRFESVPGAGNSTRLDAASFPAPLSGLRPHSQPASSEEIYKHATSDFPGANPPARAGLRRQDATDPPSRTR